MKIYLNTLKTAIKEDTTSMASILRMRTAILPEPEGVAAMDRCFVLVRNNQHGIAPGCEKDSKSSPRLPPFTQRFS